MRNRHYLLFDLAAMLLIPLLALTLRLENLLNWQEYRNSVLVYTGFSLLVKLLIYYRLGMYDRLWRYASIEEVSVILIAIFTAGFTFNIIYLLLLPLFPNIPRSIPRSVPAIDLMLSLVIHGGIRLLSRMYNTEIKKHGAETDSMKHVLIVGAGNSGTMIAKEMLRNPDNGLNPVAFIDDDRHKHGGIIYGIPVVGGRESIAETCKKLKVTQILIAMPSASGKTIQSILKSTEPLHIRTQTLPSVSELLNDTVELRQMREIRIDDLLRRDPVKTDMLKVRSMLEGERVLVTGAGGSIGSELCRLVAQCRPSQLCLLGHGENSIHAIHGELSKKYPELDLPTIIADIRDNSRIRHVFETFRPSLVYHAAAHKHVPLMEDNIVDAVTNNVLGTITLLRNARLSGVKNMTLISTDKAVTPHSVMGVTKRMAELAMQLSARENGTSFSAVRFGNVLGSRGSVVPLFTSQIAAGGPVTITHPEMRRYFMTIPEAVQLVLQASTLKGNGQIFVLDMGEPVRVLDLALDLIELSGLKPYKDIDIVFSGLRPGEKLTESLFREGEIFTRSKHEKIFVIADPSLRGNNGHSLALHTDGLADGAGIASLDEYERFIREVVLGSAKFDSDAIVAGIHRLVPEFNTNGMAETNGGDEEHVEPFHVS